MVSKTVGCRSHVAAIYLPGQDERAIAAEANALVQKTGGQLALAPLSTALQAAISQTSDVNWGVSNIGDGQTIMTGIMSITN